MRYIGLKFAICLVLITAALLGFLAAEDSDKHPGWQGSSGLEVIDNRSGVSWEQVAATLIAVADRHRVGIIRVDEDFHDGNHRRNVYVTSGEPGSDHVTWARDLLRPFGRSPTLELTVRSFEPGIVLDPRATYRVFGPPDAALDLTMRFEKLGLFGAQTSSLAFKQIFASYVLRSAGLIVALLVGLVTLTVGSVLLSARRYAVWRLHGATVAQLMGRDARALGPFFATTLLFFGMAISVFLLWYNGWNQFSIFARFVGTAAALMVIIMMLSYVLAVLAVSATSVLDALKGRVRSGPAMTLLYPLRIVAVLMVVPAAVGVAGDYAGLTNRYSALPYADRAGESVNITLPGYRTPDESDRDFEEVGAWIRQLDARGRVIVMKRDLLQDYLPALEPSGETEVLWVNDTFLAGQPVLDTAGSRVGPAPENTVRVIIPEHLNQHSDAISDNVLRSFGPAALPPEVAAPRTQRLVAANGQTIFTYAVNSQSIDSNGSPMNRPMVHDPVIVALPNGAPLVNNTRLASWASYYGVVLSPEDVTSSLGRNLPVGRISAMLPVAGLLADNLLMEFRRLISDALMLGLTIAVLALATVSTGLLYGRKHARAIYAGHVAGRSFWRIHRRALLFESIVPAAVLAWICVSNWQRAQEVAVYISRGIPAPPTVSAPDWSRLMPAMTASAVAMLLFTALLFAVHRRITSAAGSDA
ncbi:hypothetical protein LWC34_30120 [Kibdelosporangium philippinense]|uniref:Uncharacterized protein n=1 Tax=Kibdelosporangium philippinense TaxID=211113 RepID=A0ABS8ZH04_9PSEU|nr:hypothetical protein [Kibdelosporangium philippinense]MCE7007055.1 hypothetical protein [Kibdelosporangium philippinense]